MWQNDKWPCMTQRYYMPFIYFIQLSGFLFMILKFIISWELMLTHLALKFTRMFHKMILQVIFWCCPVITVSALYASNLLLQYSVTPCPRLLVSSQLEICGKGFSTRFTLMFFNVLFILWTRNLSNRTANYYPARIEAEVGVVVGA